MKITKTLIIEVKFSFEDKKKEEQEDIYNLFKKSYEETLGTSWDENKFRSRAKNWLFFGDENGYVAVRIQRSGFYKLVGVAGNIKSVYRGFEELLSLNVPVWGMVSSNIQKMVLKKGFKTPPTFLLKTLLKTIPKETFGGVDFDVNSDGSVTLKYSDVGDARKYFIGNDEYFKSIKKNILPKLKDKLPTIARKGIEMFLSENEQELDEVAWVTSKNDKINQGYIPLTPSIVKQIFGEPQRIETFHVTDEQNIDQIKKIIGKRNSISTFKYFSENYISALNGVKTTGGIVLKLEGVLDFASSDDIFSTVDDSLTRRWIRSSLLSQNLSNEVPKNGISNISQFKSYMSKIYELLDKHKDEIKNNLVNLVLNGRSGDWNELLVRNIKIKNIAWKPTKVFSQCFNKENEECVKLIDNLKNKLSEISPNVDTIFENKELINWFQKNGGFTSIEEFKKNYLKNIYKNELKKSNLGLQYLLMNSPDSLTSEQQNEARLKIFQYAMKEAEKGKSITNVTFKVLTPDQRFQYAMKRAEKSGSMSEYQFRLLTPEQQKIYKDKGGKVFYTSYDGFRLLTQDQRFQFAINLAEIGYNIPYYQFELLTQDQRFQYAMKMAEKGKGISYDQFKLLTPEQQKIFKDNGGELY